jgi:hypothetical protein
VRLLPPFKLYKCYAKRSEAKQARLGLGARLRYCQNGCLCFGKLCLAQRPRLTERRQPFER